MIEFKQVMSWLTDEMPETTEAVVCVSADGIVMRKSYKHWNKHNQGYNCRPEHIYPQSADRGKQRLDNREDKYQYVSIRGKYYPVYRLVALAWIPNPQNKPQVNHIDGVRDNNHYQNLEWCTNQENMNHAYAAGLMTRVRGDSHGCSKLTEAIVKDIKEELKTPFRGQLTRLSEKYGVGITTISEIKAGRSWGWL